VSNTPVDVLCFGEVLVDFFPERPGIPLEECDRYERHIGGAPANVAIGLGRLGMRPGLMTLVGPDAFGVYVKRKLAEEGVDVRGVGLHRTAKTGVTFVAVDAEGGRSFLFFRHPSADQMIAPVDVDANLVAEATVLHVGSSTLSREPARAATWAAIDAARRTGRLVSSDPNWRAHLWEDPRVAMAELERLLASVDIVKVSDDELAPLVGVSDPVEGAAKLRALGATVAVVTLGARGCLFDAPAGRGELPGERPPTVVDSTGAGDAFTAGLLTGLLRAGVRDRETLHAVSLDALRAACTLGNRMGAAAVTRLGATAGLPARAQSVLGP
jgi:fructokinase